jgi:hypothetical protein
MDFLVAVVAGVIGALAVLGGVWLAQFLQDKHQASLNVEAAFRAAESKLLLLLEAVDRKTGQLLTPWREDFYSFSASVNEINSLLVKLRDLHWKKGHRKRFDVARLSVEEFQERFAAATAKLGQGDSLTEAEITTLSQGLTAADRRWRADYGSYDPDAELEQFVEHVRHYMAHGIDAPAPE